MSTTNESKQNQVNSTVARSDDGTIQITFNIPPTVIETEKKKAIDSLGKNIEVPGFRKGLAPIEKIIEKIPQDKLSEKILSQILPEALEFILKKESIKPIVYPKFELINQGDNETWQIRAVTCELPVFSLGDYKGDIIGDSKAQAIWTPDKAGTESSKEEKPEEKSPEEKQSIVLKSLLNHIKITIPKILIDEEVNSRLAKLLERTEKLGLSLENYLSSIGKKPEEIRNEYEKQAREAIIIELVLNKIAETEKVEVSESEIDESIKALSASPENRISKDNKDARLFISSVLKRQKVMAKLISYI